jgi:hypothetical protein
MDCHHNGHPDTNGHPDASGHPDDACLFCVCPDWWAGQHCEFSYVTATFYLNLNLAANDIDVVHDLSDLAGMVQLLEDDIIWALAPTTFLYLAVHEVVPSGARTKVTVRFGNYYDSSPSYNGDVRIAQRDALRMQIMDPTSPYRTTVTGQYADEDSFTIQNPPATPAGALSIVPSIFTLCLALLATMVVRA